MKKLILFSFLFCGLCRAEMFAKVDTNNVVTTVIVADANFVASTQKGTWVQTYKNGGIRKNRANPGYTYDSNRDAFIPPKPYPSWDKLDEVTCKWKSPIPMPTDGKRYAWDEKSKNWVEGKPIGK